MNSADPDLASVAKDLCIQLEFLSGLPSPPEDLGNPAISEEEVRRALNSFRPGSAGGPDGIRPGHLRSLTRLVAAEAGARLERLQRAMSAPLPD